MKRVIKIILSFLMGVIISTTALFLVGYFGIIQTYKIYVVTSGSMEPALKVGSLTFVVPSEQYFSNDIVTFIKNGDKKNSVTHRIIAKKYESNKTIFYTSGDANKTLDQGAIEEQDIIGKVLFSVPYVGYFVNFVKNPKGFILFVIVPITIIIYEELKSLKNETSTIIKKIKKKKNEEAVFLNKSSGVNKSYLIIPIITVAFALMAISNSFFFDNEKSPQNSFAAGTWITTTPSPTPTTTPEITPTPIQNLADHVVISEIQTKGNGSNNMFVEFYNPTNSVIDISSWSLQYRGPNATGYEKKNFEVGNIIPANGFFLFGHNGSNLSPAPDLTASIALAQSGGTVFLINNQVILDEITDSGPTVVDKVAYGTGSHLRPEGSSYSDTPLENQSIERKAYFNSDSVSMMSGSDILKGNAYDSENNINDFILRTASQPQNSTSPIEIP